MAEEQAELAPRESMDYDVVIVGAGMAGLATAIRLKQVNADLSVVLIEKGSEPGAHILSGAIVDPIGLNRLLPGWEKRDDAPLKTQVKDDCFFYLTQQNAIRVPDFLMPKMMDNSGNYIGSLGNTVRFLAAEAEKLGVEIYPGFAGAEILYDGDKVIGIATGDMGIGRDGKPRADFARGMELRGKYTVLAEGARGSLSKQILAKYDLEKNCDPQKFGIGFKELWRIPKENHHPGLVQHTFGWPLDPHTTGGSFLYHFEEDLISLGFVLHLNYKNPTISPFDEFQRFKSHPKIAAQLEGGTRISYGARALTEGGWQSVPKLVFPGGALVGCAAGFMNLPRIKGSHNAVLSGIQAADQIAGAIAQGRSHDEVTEYDQGWRDSEIGQDLKPVRNVKPLWSKFGTIWGTPLYGLDLWTNQLFGFSFFGTLRHKEPDFAELKPLSAVTPIKYEKLTGPTVFDKPSSVFVSNTNHDEDQPIHLKLADPSVPIKDNLPAYGEPARLYCPAGVYEVVYADEAAKTDPRFVINAQNCVHCKTCDIKDPAHNITWTPPEGGGGPNYPNM